MLSAQDKGNDASLKDGEIIYSYDRTDADKSFPVSFNGGTAQEMTCRFAHQPSSSIWIQKSKNNLSSVTHVLNKKNNVKELFNNRLTWRYR